MAGCVRSQSSPVRHPRLPDGSISHRAAATRRLGGRSSKAIAERALQLLRPRTAWARPEPVFAGSPRLRAPLSDGQVPRDARGRHPHWCSLEDGSPHRFMTACVSEEERPTGAGRGPFSMRASTYVWSAPAGGAGTARVRPRATRAARSGAPGGSMLATLDAWRSSVAGLISRASAGFSSARARDCHD